MGAVSFREDDWERFSAGLREVMEDLQVAEVSGTAANVRHAVKKARKWMKRVEPLLAEVDEMAAKVESQPEFQTAAQFSLKRRALDKALGQIVHLQEENRVLVEKNSALENQLERCMDAVDKLRT